MTYWNHNLPCSIWIIVEQHGESWVDATSGMSVEDAFETICEHWKDHNATKIWFVKEMEDPRGLGQDVELLREFERDGRSIARRAANLIRTEIFTNDRLYA